MEAGQYPYATQPDGSAKNAAAFQKALLEDADKMKALESEVEVLKIVKGQDLQAFQKLLRTVYAVRPSDDTSTLFPHSTSVKYTTVGFRLAMQLYLLLKCRQRKREWSESADPWQNEQLTHRELPLLCQGNSLSSQVSFRKARIRYIQPEPSRIGFGLWRHVRE